MAGKTKKGAGWGGKRKNQTGRPKKEPENHDLRFKSDVIEALAKLEKKHNKKFLEAIFEMAYSENVQSAVKASLLKIYAEIFTVKKSESDIQVTKNEGIKEAVRLPPKKQDPALKVVGGNN